MTTLKKRNRLFKMVLPILLLCLSMTVNASSDSYVLDGLQRVPAPALYEKDAIFQTFKDTDGNVIELSKPQDLYISSQGNIFIVDSGNHRIVKTDKTGKVLNIFGSGDEKGFNNPQGIFVDKNENMYIADTDNERIVHLDYMGNFVEALGRPEGLPGDDTTYNPAKIAISSTGIIYVVKGQNILSIDANNKFKGYIGQSEIGFDLTEALIRVFASEEQKATLVQRTAATYNNIVIDENDSLYCASMDSKIGEIKKLNTVGTNTYRETGGASVFSINFASLFLSNSYITSSGTAFYGDRKDDDGKNVKPNLVDVAFDSNNLVYALDSVTCRVFIYDAEGELLGTVGSYGDQKGKFMTPSAISVDENGIMYVLDASTSSIQSFTPTAFKQSVEQALTLYYNGQYDESQEYWQKVLDINQNYTLALKGMGQTYYKEGNYTKAMSCFKSAGDVKGYSDAFGKQLHNQMRSHFNILVVVLIIVLVVCVVFAKLLLSASKSVCRLHDTADARRFDYWQQVKLCFSALFHPCETFENVRYMRGHLKLSPPFIFLGLTIVVRIIYMHIVHYPLADIELLDASYLLEAMKFLIPFVTFVIAAYAVTSLIDGEVKMQELFFASSLCFAPYFIFTLPLGAFSHVLNSNHSGFYSTMQTIILIWMLFLFFQTVRVMNRYSVKRAVGVTLLSALAMVLIWIVLILVIVLWNQIYIFATGILNELGIIAG